MKHLLLPYIKIRSKLCAKIGIQMSLGTISASLMREWVKVWNWHGPTLTPDERNNIEIVQCKQILSLNT